MGQVEPKPGSAVRTVDVFMSSAHNIEYLSDDELAKWEEIRDYVLRESVESCALVQRGTFCDREEPDAPQYWCNACGARRLVGLFVGDFPEEPNP